MSNQPAYRLHGARCRPTPAARRSSSSTSPSRTSSCRSTSATRAIAPGSRILTRTTRSPCSSTAQLWLWESHAIPAVRGNAGARPDYLPARPAPPAPTSTAGCSGSPVTSRRRSARSAGRGLEEARHRSGRRPRADRARRGGVARRREDRGPPPREPRLAGRRRDDPRRSVDRGDAGERGDVQGAARSVSELRAIDDRVAKLPGVARDDAAGDDARLGQRRRARPAAGDARRAVGVDVAGAAAAAAAAVGTAGVSVRSTARSPRASRRSRR